jgi:hypothetical protein
MSSTTVLYGHGVQVKEKRKEAKKKLGIDNPKIEEDDPTV